MTKECFVKEFKYRENTYNVYKQRYLNKTYKDYKSI